MATFTLTLTDEQMETLGYALTLAKRSLLHDVNFTDTKRRQVANIEDLRCIVDACPSVEG